MISVCSAFLKTSRAAALFITSSVRAMRSAFRVSVSNVLLTVLRSMAVVSACAALTLYSTRSSTVSASSSLFAVATSSEQKLVYVSTSQCLTVCGSTLLTVSVCSAVQVVLLIRGSVAVRGSRYSMDSVSTLTPTEMLLTQLRDRLCRPVWPIIRL